MIVPDSNNEFVRPLLPVTNKPHIAVASKTSLSPGAAAGFVFDKSITYGLGFGAAYGAGLGLFVWIVGAIFGMVIGGFIGLFLGLIEGAILSLVAAYLVRKDVPIPALMRTLQIVSPIVAMAVGAWPVAISGQAGSNDISGLTYWFARVVYIAAVVGSWHAARVATKEFTEHIER